MLPLNSMKIFLSNLELLLVIESTITLLILENSKSHNSVKIMPINLKIERDLPTPNPRMTGYV